MRTTPLVLAIAVVAFPAAAQAPRQLRLKPPTAELSEEFTLIGSVRELSDGRVLISDPRENRVVVADLKTGAVQQVGRQGQGPGEYALAAALIPLAGDSSLLVDGRNRRWLLFSGAAIAVTVPADNQVIRSLKSVARGADGRGNVWTLASPRPAIDENNVKSGTITFGPADSEYVVRANRGSGRVDTLTQVRLAVSQQTLTASASGRLTTIEVVRPPLSVGEEAALFQDGWLAVARLGPYRVDWITPEGRLTLGRPLPFTPIKSTKAERDGFFERQKAAMPVTARGGAGGGLPPGLQAQLDAMREQFPDEFPPFTNGVIAGGDGNLYLRHPPTLKFPDFRYDMVGRTGQLLGVVTLGKRERIVAVSRGSVYVAWKDADDIERLRRHPLAL
jgi:hypothetical protein